MRPKNNTLNTGKAGDIISGRWLRTGKQYGPAALMSVTEELAVRSVKRARACTKAFRSSSRWKMQAILGKNRVL
jgi:hypothetical protein